MPPWRPLLLLILLVLMLESFRMLFFVQKSSQFTPDDIISSLDQNPSSVYPISNILEEGSPTICLSICHSSKDDLQKVEKYGNMANELSRQINQAVNLMKSAVALTKQEYLNLIVLVDESWIFSELLKRIKTWPARILKKLKIQQRSVWYPDTRTDFRSLFRVCSSEKLFLTEALPDVDAVIYLDTDVLFMSPPEELWNQFYSFTALQISGLAPSLYVYDRGFKLPHYSKTGLNSGMWMMNLTRMRAFPGGWIVACLNIYDQFSDQMKLIDQAIANYFFYENPDMVYEVECRWNYRWRMCSKGSQLCKSAKNKGVALMHGSGLVFFDGSDLKWKKFYEAWDKYELEMPLGFLLASMRSLLQEVNHKKNSKCKKIKDIDKIFTRGLQNYTIQSNKIEQY